MSWVRGHFDLPATPDGTEMPQTAQLVATLSMGVLVAGFTVYAIREIARRRSVTLALLLIGGAISYFNEPIDDVLGLVWHPLVGQWTALDTFSRVPLWGLGIYIVFFGGMPYLILQNLLRGMTRWQLWGWVGGLRWSTSPSSCRFWPVASTATTATRRCRLVAFRCIGSSSTRWDRWPLPCCCWLRETPRAEQRLQRPPR